MANSIFSFLKSYAVENPWTVNEEKTKYFTSEDVALIESAVVVSGDYGLSVKMRRKDGYISFAALSRDSKLAQGELVDLSRCKLLCLERRGEDDIYRLEELY